LGDVIASVLVGSLWVLSPKVAMTYVIVTSLLGAILIVALPDTREKRAE